MIAVRRAEDGDVSRIVEIAAQTVSSAWTDAYVKSRLGRDDTALYVAVMRQPGDQKSRIVGFAASRQVGDDGELLQIATDPNYRRRGIGSLLLGAILKDAMAVALHSVFLEVRTGNEAAIALYESHGFTKVRVRESYYTDPVEDAVIYVCIL